MINQKQKELIIHAIYTALDELRLGIMLNVNLSLNGYQIIINGNTYHERNDKEDLIDRIIQQLVNTYNLYLNDYEMNGKLGFSILMEIYNTDDLITLIKMKGLALPDIHIATVNFVNALPEDVDSKTMYIVGDDNG